MAMEGLLGLLIAIVVVCLIAYVIFWALGQIPLPDPIRTIIIVLVALILLIFIVQRFGLLSGL
jgi:hypothetical protein